MAQGLYPFPIRKTSLLPTGPPGCGFCALVTPGVSTVPRQLQLLPLTAPLLSLLSRVPDVGHRSSVSPRCYSQRTLYIPTLPKAGGGRRAQHQGDTQMPILACLLKSPLVIRSCQFSFPKILLLGPPPVRKPSSAALCPVGVWRTPMIPTAQPGASGGPASRESRWAQQPPQVQDCRTEV